MRLLTVRIATPKFKFGSAKTVMIGPFEWRGVVSLLHGANFPASGRTQYEWSYGATMTGQPIRRSTDPRTHFTHTGSRRA